MADRVPKTPVDKRKKLVVTIQNQEGQQQFFRVKYSTQLGKVRFQTHLNADHLQCTRHQTTTGVQNLRNSQKRRSGSFQIHF